jgi:hypothetical protein
MNTYGQGRIKPEGEKFQGGPGPPIHKERKHVLPQYIIQRGEGRKKYESKRFSRTFPK